MTSCFKITVVDVLGKFETIYFSSDFSVVKASQKLETQGYVVIEKDLCSFQEYAEAAYFGHKVIGKVGGF